MSRRSWRRRRPRSARLWRLGQAPPGRGASGLPGAWSSGRNAGALLYVIMSGPRTQASTAQRPPPHAPGAHRYPHASRVPGAPALGRHGTRPRLLVAVGRRVVAEGARAASRPWLARLSGDPDTGVQQLPAPGAVRDDTTPSPHRGVSVRFVSRVLGHEPGPGASPVAARSPTTGVPRPRPETPRGSSTLAVRPRCEVLVTSR
jgi:hypothetical protein